MRSTPRKQAIGPLTIILASIAMASATTSYADDPQAVFASGHDTALNRICGQGRSGRSWELAEADAEARTAGALVETVVPAAGRTDIVSVMPMAIVPCVRVTVATDALGGTTCDIAVDAANVNRDFNLTDIHTGGALQFCPAAPTAPGVVSRSAGAIAGAANRFNRGHETALNTLCGEGRSGRTWILASGGMTETIVPTIGRTDIVGFLPMGIIPCVRVVVATDELGQTRYELAVDTENANRDFRMTDIHTGESLVLCPARRLETPSILPARATSWSAIKAGR